MHDGNFVIDGLVSADRIPRPGLADFKKVIEPIRMAIDDEWRMLLVSNQHDVLDLRAFAFRWTVAGPTGVLRSGELARIKLGAHGHGSQELPAEVAALRADDRVLTVQAELREGNAWAPAGHEIAWAQSGQPADARLAVRSRAPIELGARSIRVGPAVFERQTGLLTSLRGIPMAGPELTLWRAPTDNDRGVDGTATGRSTVAEVWDEAGLGLLVSRTVSVTQSERTLVVVRRSGAPGRDRFVDVRFTWSADAGTLLLTVELEPSASWGETWARVGLEFILRSEFDWVEWAGRGPGPAYPDTGQAAKWGWHTASVDELQVDYARPQENGSRAGVSSLALVSHGSNRTLKLSGELFSFTARRWPTSRLAASHHPFQLVDDGTIHLIIDYRQQGIGTASCGPGVLPKSVLRPGATKFSISFTSQ